MFPFTRASHFGVTLILTHGQLFWAQLSWWNALVRRGIVSSHSIVFQNVIGQKHTATVLSSSIRHPEAKQCASCAAQETSLAYWPFEWVSLRLGCRTCFLRLGSFVLGWV